MTRFNNRKLIHWIASFAILMGALAPAISQALSVSKAGQGFVVEVCSTTGSKTMQVISDDETAPSVAMENHCPYCVIQPIYLLSTDYAYEFVAPQGFGLDLGLAHLAPALSAAWLTFSSRAPPAQS